MLSSLQNGQKGGNSLWKKVIRSDFELWKLSQTEKNVSVYLWFGKYKVEILYFLAYNEVFAKGSVM